MLEDPVFLFRDPFFSALDSADERIKVLYRCSDRDGCIRKFRSARRMLSFKGFKHEGKGYSDVLLKYRDIASDNYVKIPIVSVARGTVVRVYDNGEYRVVAFPFAKFFNYREIPGAEISDVAHACFTKKLDGTLIVVWRDPDTGEIRYNTRGMLDYHGIIRGKTGSYTVGGAGVSNPFVRAFINAVKRMRLWYELESLVVEGRTVMFELTCRIPASMDAGYVFKIPLDDPSYKPYLLGYRDGERLVYPITDSAFPVPETIRVGSVYELLELVSSWRDEEGVVGYVGGYYDDRLPWWDKLVKYKSTVYVLRAMVSKNNEISWKKIAVASLGKHYDDLVSLINDQEIAGFVKTVRQKYEELLGVWSKIVDRTREKVEENGWDGVIREYRSKNLGYMARYIGISVKHGYDAGLKIMLKENMPAKKEKILKFMDRLGKRLETVLEKYM